MDDIEVSVCMSDVATLKLAKAAHACDVTINQFAVAAFTDYVLCPRAKAAARSNKREDRYCGRHDDHHARGWVKTR